MSDRAAKDPAAAAGGKTSVRVTILGEEYSIRSPTSAEETQAIAKQVDTTIRDILASKAVVETHKAAILACLRLAGELAAAREASGSLDAGMAKLSDEIRPWLPPSKRRD